MFIRPIFLLLLLLLIWVPATYGAPLDDWNALVVEGSKKKFDGKYDDAAQTFTKAVEFASKQNQLPNKCLPISLCRLAESQLNANMVRQADSHFEQITKIVKDQKASGKLDGQVSFWVAALSDAYLSNHKPETRELCIKHACYLKTLVYGASHRNCTDCLNKLAQYYLDANKVDKALKILEMNEGLTAKQFGKNPDRFGDLLNDLAIKCEKEHKYNQAKQLEQEVIKIAKSNKTEINAGIPVFSFFLSLNSLDRNQPDESKKYFHEALMEGSKTHTAAKKKLVCKYLSILPDYIWKLRLSNELVKAEIDYERMLELYKIISTNLQLEYNIVSSLADVLFSEDVRDHASKRSCEAMKYLNRSIEIAQYPKSKLKDTLPGSYMRLGVYYASAHELDQTEYFFNKALELEKDKNGYEAAGLFFWEGWNLELIGQRDLAVRKLNIAYKRSRALAPAERGTLLADLLQMLAYDAQHNNQVEKAKKLFQESTAEISLQKKLNSKLGPDAYHRM